MTQDASLSKIRSSFSFKLFSIFTILTACTVVTFASLHIIGQIRDGREHASEIVRLQTAQLADNVRLPLYAENREKLQQLAGEASRAVEVRRVLISAADGRVLTDFRPAADAGTEEILGETVEVFSIPEGISVETAFSGGQEKPSARIGSVRIERGTGDLAQKNRRFIIATSTMALAFWAAVSFLGFLAFRRLTRSYQALVRGIEKVRSGDYAARIDVEIEDAPGRAALAINQLADSLQQREQENRRLHDELLEAFNHETQSKEKLAELNSSLEEEISERIQIEHKLRDSKKTIQNLVELMPAGVVWIDRDGRIEYLNRYFVDLFGYVQSDIPTIADWYQLAYPDPDYRNEVFASSMEESGKSDGDDKPPSPKVVGITCKNGSVLQVMVNSQLILERRLWVLVDITEREQLQDQLIKSQKLESLGVLAGGIAHNFNNVLTGIMGYISYARVFLDDSHKAGQPLEKAEKASKRAAGMANQLLTFARGGMPVKKRISIRRIVDESVSLSLIGTNVQSKVEIGDQLQSVKADEGQLSQTFNNILINAAQAMPRGGTLLVHGENVTLESGNRLGLKPGTFIRLAFADEGCGIPATDLKKIFDPYFTTKPEGTGLGLATVHSIIDKHGGHVGVRSAVGKGTTFIIHLPSTPEIPQEQPPLPGLPVMGVTRGGKILVMDDEETIRDFAEDCLDFMGYLVTTCRDGKEATTLYREASEQGQPFMAVILDLTVPGGMGGVEAAEQILAYDPDARLIVSSGYSYDPVMAGYRNFGFCAAVPKPYDSEMLAQELDLLQAL